MHRIYNSTPTHFFAIGAYDLLMRVFDLNVIPVYEPESHPFEVRMRSRIRSGTTFGWYGMTSSKKNSLVAWKVIVQKPLDCEVGPHVEARNAILKGQNDLVTRLT